jgi:hypothetical protein
MSKSEAVVALEAARAAKEKALLNNTSPIEEVPVPSSLRLSSKEVPLGGSSSVGVALSRRAFPSTPAVQHYRRRKGRQGRISSTELALWSHRLAAESALVELAYPEVPDLLPQVLSSRKVWDGFLLLVACRWARVWGAPVAFARPFAAAWCEVSEDVARENITRLARANYMLEVGRHGHLREWLPRRRD